MRDIGYNEASRSENVQKQAMPERISQVIIRKMDIKKQKARKKSKIKEDQETRDRVYERKWT